MIALIRQNFITLEMGAGRSATVCFGKTLCFDLSAGFLIFTEMQMLAFLEHKKHNPSRYEGYIGWLVWVGDPSSLPRFTADPVFCN